MSTNTCGVVKLIDPVDPRWAVKLHTTLRTGGKRLVPPLSGVILQTGNVSARLCLCYQMSSSGARQVFWYLHPHESHVKHPEETVLQDFSSADLMSVVVFGSSS